MSLVLEIEYLLGTCFASIGPDSDLPDWPPQPDRIFSALLSAWGARAEKTEEARALQWLEAQPAPKIQASDHFPRTAPISFVPPNDPETGRLGNKTLLPVFRRRQPRRFPASRPYSPVVRLFWSDAGLDSQTLSALKALAADTAYVGHSASLTRCQFERTNDVSALREGRMPKRSVYQGRFAELQRS